MEDVAILFDYELTGKVMPFISRNNYQIKKIQYSDQTTIHLKLRKSVLSAFGREIADLTAGQVQIQSAMI